MNNNIAILSPVYNDWDSYFRLLNELSNFEDKLDIQLHMFAIDDGSDESLDRAKFVAFERSAIAHLEVLHLIKNLGHQRAIAVGLSHIYKNGPYDAIIVMDADGEDRPEDLLKLIRIYLDTPEQAVVAQRSKRSEDWKFRMLYSVYKILFRILVGKRVEFGNFCVLPPIALQRLVYDSNIWNHLAAAIIRSGLPIRKIKTQRGLRYSGSTKMSLEPYVIHGLSAISVFSDRVFVRVMIAFTILALVAFIGILVVVSVRLFTELAIPGWATSTVGLLLLILLQALFFLGIASFSLLYQRTSPSLIPALDAEKYVRFVEVIWPNERE